MIMMAGIYYGAMYGGSTTSILVNIPGESASVITCLDGYKMALQGRAGAALGIAAFGSFIAGTLGVVGLMIFAVPLAKFGLKFGPPEYFGAILLGLMLVSYLSGGSKIKALMMAAFGIILSCIGLDPIEASPRMTFNLLQLWDGVNLVPIAMGIFGIGEILINIEEILKIADEKKFMFILTHIKTVGVV
jgi:putative tricarboxylic transport membrane protein